MHLLIIYSLPLHILLLFLVVLNNNGIKCVIEVFTNAMRCSRLRAMYDSLLVVLWHLLVRQRVADEFSPAKLGRGCALTQLRVGLIHLLGTQAAIGVDKCTA